LVIRRLLPTVDVERGDGIVTGVRLHIWAALTVLLMGASGLDAALAQTPLTLEDAIRHGQGDTADARALASSIEEANARIQRAESGYWHAVRGSEPIPVRVYELVSEDGDPAKGRPDRRPCTGDASHKYAITRWWSGANM
jgi:hypothetical protein